jgi:hypothetical protein
MKLYGGKRPRTLCLFVLTLLCVSLPAGRAAAQCCCGGVHVTVYGRGKKPITPTVTALVGLGEPGEATTPRLIEPAEGDEGEKAIRVSADCFGFSLMEITVAHEGERMVLRLRDVPFGELGEIYLEPFPFRRGTSEIDFKGELKGNCKEAAEGSPCVIPSARWRRVSGRPEAELSPPRAKSDQHQAPSNLFFCGRRGMR